MGKLSNLKKKLIKNDHIVGLANPDQWASLGNHALNYVCTGSFTKGIPNRRTVMFAGESGTGKSFLMANAAKNIQMLGYKIIYIDTEFGLDEDYLVKIGVDIEDEEKFICIQAQTLEEVSELISEIFNEFDKEEKIALFIDSLGMLDTEDRNESFDKDGSMKNDMGIVAKKTKFLMKSLNRNVGLRDMFCIVNQHVYQNQDITNGEGTHVLSGGTAQIYIPSISLMMKKFNLKEGKDIVGVKMKISAKKTRFYKLGTTITLEVPWKGGIDPYDGVLDLFVTEGVVNKNGAWYSFEDDDGKEIKFQRSKFSEYAGALIDAYDLEEDEIEEDEDDSVDSEKE
tara:strand:- start:2649 stop:3668 length:1020 start_codon:yes stop_codon:yes gene_type:complete